MVAGLLSAFLPLVRPDAVGAEVLLTAGMLLVALAAAVLLHATGAPSSARLRIAPMAFAAMRPLLRASDPSAPGHRRARAPGTSS